MTKWVAPAGTTRLACRHRDELAERFPGWMLEGLISERLGTPVESEVGDVLSDEPPDGESLPGKMTDPVRAQAGDVVYVPSEEECFYDVLWNLGEQMGCGLSIDMEAVPFLQMAIEVCEALGEDILELPMDGCALVVTQDAVRILEHYPEGAVIGRLSEGRARVLVYNDRETYITPPVRRKHKF